jgi:hypothetical protein
VLGVLKTHHSLSAAALSMTIMGYGVIKYVTTTQLMPWSEGSEAMKKEKAC